MGQAAESQSTLHNHKIRSIREQHKSQEAVDGLRWMSLENPYPQDRGLAAPFQLGVGSQGRDWTLDTNG